MRHPAYPRINCCIAGCKRGTTRYPGDVEIICGKCFRKVPQAWRKRLALYRRKINAAEHRGDEQAYDKARWLFERRWDAIKKLLSNPTPDDTGLPPTMTEELRREGLL